MSTITTAAREYATRPQDERFPSLDAMVQHAVTEKNLSIERTYNLKDLRVDAVNAASAGQSIDHLASSVIPAAEQGLILASPKGAASMSHWAFGQLCRTLGAPAAYLRDLPATIAADALNFGLSDSTPGTAVNMLVRGQNGAPPMIRACTSDTYGRVFDADLYGAIVAQFTRYDKAWTLPPTWSGEPAGAYRGDRDSFLILTNGGSIVTDPSLSGRQDGSMFRGLLVRNSEVGAASITIEQILYRYVCGNHMLWGAVVDKQFRRRHVGARVLRDTIREIGEIAWKWTHRSADRDQAIIRALIDHEVASTREAVIDELQAMGATKDQATTMYETCEQRESVSPRSYWGLAQGATRMSQDTGYQDERYQIDRLAGQILARGAKLVAVA